MLAVAWKGEEFTRWRSRVWCGGGGTFGEGVYLATDAGRTRAYTGGGETEGEEVEGAKGERGGRGAEPWRAAGGAGNDRGWRRGSEGTEEDC